jgi:hypothetical protein
MTRRIAHLIEEQENRSKLFRNRNLDVKVERTHKDLRHLFVQESRAPTPDREEVFPLNPSKDHQQREVTMPEKIRIRMEGGIPRRRSPGRRIESSIRRKQR